MALTRAQRDGVKAGALERKALGRLKKAEALVREVAVLYADIDDGVGSIADSETVTALHELAKRVTDATEYLNEEVE